MEALWERTTANGLEREWLEAEALKEREPNITGVAGIFVPSSSLSDLRLMDELRRGFFTPPCVGVGVGVGVGAVVWLLTCPSASARRF